MPICILISEDELLGLLGCVHPQETVKWRVRRLQSQRHAPKGLCSVPSEGKFFFTLEAPTLEAQQSKGPPGRAAAGEEAPGVSGLCGTRRQSYARGTLNHSMGFCPLQTALPLSLQAGGRSGVWREESFFVAHQYKSESNWQEKNRRGFWEEETTGRSKGVEARRCTCVCVCMFEGKTP